MVSYCGANHKLLLDCLVPRIRLCFLGFRCKAPRAAFARAKRPGCMSLQRYILVTADSGTASSRGVCECPTVRALRMTDGLA